MKLTVKLPNFTLTRGKVPGAASTKGRRNLRRTLRTVFVWGGVGLVFFVFFAWLSLPTRALAWRISHEAKAHGYLIDIEDVSISPFGGVTLENVRWTYQPSRPGQVPMSLDIEEVDIDISMLSLLMGDIDVDLEIEFDEGRDGAVTGNYTRSDTESSFKLEIEDMPLYRVPKATQALNAPLRGILAIKVDLTMPENKFGDATGTIELTCAACTVGDGVEKLFVPGSQSLKSGVVVPEIDMGTLSGRMTVEDGIAKTDGPIETKSDDVWIQLSGEINFQDPFAKSRIAMELKFNLSEKLQDESEPMRFMIQTANPLSKLDPPEVGLGFRLEGPLVKPRFIGIKSKSRRQMRLDRRAEQRERDEKRRSSRRTSTASKGKPATKPDSAKPTIGEPLDATPLDPEDSPDRPALPTPRELPEPGVEEPAVEEPAVEEPAVEEPAVEEPAVEEPAVEEPAVEEPADGGDGNEAPADGGDGNEAPADDGNADANGNDEQGQDDGGLRGEGGEGEGGAADGSQDGAP